MKVLAYLLIASFALSKHLRDEIAYHNSSFEWEWLKTNNWETESWWLKNVFTMFLDGWHFMEFVNVMSFSIIASIAILKTLGARSRHYYWLPLALYILIGFIHSLLDGSFL